MPADDQVVAQVLSGAPVLPIPDAVLARLRRVISQEAATRSFVAEDADPEVLPPLKGETTLWSPSDLPDYEL